MTGPERDAWSMIYRLYEKHSETLRQVDPDAAARIFTEIVHDVTSKWDSFTDPARLILLTGIGLLDDVWRSGHVNRE